MAKPLADVVKGIDEIVLSPDFSAKSTEYINAHCDEFEFGENKLSWTQIHTDCENPSFCRPARRRPTSTVVHNNALRPPKSFSDSALPLPLSPLLPLFSVLPLNKSAQTWN